MLKAATAIVVLLNWLEIPLDAILPIEPNIFFITGDKIRIEKTNIAGVSNAKEIIIGAIPR